MMDLGEIVMSNEKEYILKTKKDGTIITVKDVHNVLLEIITDIDELCREHNIEYCLTGGSTLGAMRHKGFIPWDDDIDIAMMRSEYNKFIKVLDTYLPKDKYVYHCYEKSNKYDVTWPAMKIRRKGTYIKETNKLLFNKCKDSDGLFVDVFIYDHMAKSTFLDLPLRFINTVLLMPIITSLENLRINPVPIKALFRMNAIVYGKLCSKSNYIGDDITWTYKSPLKPLRYIKKNMFPVVYTEFENTKLPVPNDVNDYLTRRYGPNYMTPPPISKQQPKHVFDINLSSDYPED